MRGGPNVQNLTPPKKIYRAPEIQVYGNVRDLTRTNPAGAGADDGHSSGVRKLTT
jgi:hypothetical protein